MSALTTLPRTERSVSAQYQRPRRASLLEIGTFACALIGTCGGGGVLIYVGRQDKTIENHDRLLNKLETLLLQIAADINKQNERLSRIEGEVEQLRVRHP